jgi:hypothetical protein
MHLTLSADVQAKKEYDGVAVSTLLTPDWRDIVDACLMACADRPAVLLLLNHAQQHKLAQELSGRYADLDRVSGDVLLVSTVPPPSGWSDELGRRLPRVARMLHDHEMVGLTSAEGAARVAENAARLITEYCGREVTLPCLIYLDLVDAPGEPGVKAWEAVCYGIEHLNTPDRLLAAIAHLGRVAHVGLKSSDLAQVAHDLEDPRSLRWRNAWCRVVDFAPRFIGLLEKAKTFAGGS